jgi:hypothetical protein
MFTALFLSLFAADAAQVSVLGTLTRESEVSPGQLVSGELTLVNESADGADVVLYVRDYRTSADQSSEFPQLGSLDRSNAAWIGLPTDQVHLDPGQRLAVPYQIQVPSSLDLDGTHWSVILIEPVGGQFKPINPNNQSAVQIDTVFRTAVQVVTHVAGPQAPQVQFLNGQVVEDGGRDELWIDLGNQGDRWVVPAVWAELFDPQGLSLGRFDAGKRRLYPDSSQRFSMDLGELPQGTYKAMVVVDGGASQVWGSTFELDI